MPEPTRQLAAIMFTDIVGYTTLMGQDSNKALELVRKSKEIQKPLVDKHNGQWLKEIGDGALAKFSTALDAVNWGVEIQKGARAEFDGKLRIGIHLGDITIENEDVYGDGVNVASRLESIADPGGIYISESIEKAIRGRTDVQAKLLGEVKLKNVDYDVKTYAVQGVGLPVPEVKDQNELSGHVWAEVQRRGVIRAGTTYLMLSVILILLLPYGESFFPEWATTGLIIVLGIGFPVSMYLAWNFERSPEGFVKTISRQSWQNPYKEAQRKPLTSNFIFIGLGVIMLLLFVYSNFSFPRAEVAAERKLVQRFHILFPDDAPMALTSQIGSKSGSSNRSIALSPIGRVMAYVALIKDHTQLHLRYLNDTRVVPLEGTENGFAPLFSPDGKWLVYGSKGAIMKLAVPDGTPVNIASTGDRDFWGGLWTNAGEIIFFDSDFEIYRVPARGGEPKLLTERVEDFSLSFGSSILSFGSSISITPDHKTILYSDFSSDIYGLNLETGKKILIYEKGGGSPQYIPTGHLTFTRDNVLFAVPFDLKTMSPRGDESQIINNVRTERVGPQMAWSYEGTAIHVKGQYYQRSAFTWINQNEQRQRIDLEPDSYGSYDLSPDGNLIVHGMLPAEDYIRVIDLRSGRKIQVKLPGTQQLYGPVWGPGNESIIFGSYTQGKWKLYRKNINEVGEAQELEFQRAPNLSFGAGPYSWSEGGDFFTQGSYIFKVSSGSAVIESVGTTEVGHHMAISPNNDYLVYASGESGQQEIYVQPFPATSEKWQLSVNGGTDPIWSPDGRRIYYHNNLQISFVEVNYDENLEFGRPQVYYSGPFLNIVSRSLSISPNGERLLILEPIRGNLIATEVIVTLNWFEELKRLAPATE